MTTQLTTLLLLFALAPLAEAQYTYKEETVAYQTIDVPFAGARLTVVTGKDGPDLGGVYLDANDHLHTWTRDGRGRFTAVPLLELSDLSAAGQVGSYTDPFARSDADTGRRGYLWVDGTLTTLQVPREPGIPPRPRSILTEAAAISDTGLIGGTFRREGTDTFHVFLYDAHTNTYSFLNPPEAVTAQLLSLSPTSKALLRATGAEGQRHQYVWDAGTFTELNIPDLPDAELVGRTDSGILAGNLGSVGVVWDGTRLHEIEAPGSVFTDINNITADGKAVYGSFRDEAGGVHGFVATLGRGKARHQAQRTTKMATVVRAEDCGPGSKRAVCQEQGQ